VAVVDKSAVMIIGFRFKAKVKAQDHLTRSILCDILIIGVKKRV